MRYLGIDYGHKKVGVAISDESGHFAFPYGILPTNKYLAKSLAEICQKEGVGVIVLGESLDYNFRPNKIMPEITEFKVALEEATGLPVEFEGELLTSAEAERLVGRDKMLDARAAALILKNYLDRKSD